MGFRVRSFATDVLNFGTTRPRTAIREKSRSVAGSREQSTVGCEHVRNLVSFLREAQGLGLTGLSNTQKHRQVT